MLLPLALPTALDYSVELPLPRPGQFVEAPLGPNERIGVVWPFAVDTGKRVDESRLKPVTRVLDGPGLTEAHLEFLHWLADYTMSIPGTVLRMSMGIPEALRPPPTRMHYFIEGDLPPKLTEKRQRVVDAIDDGRLRTVRQISSLSGVSDGVVRGLIKAGLLVGVETSVERPVDQPDPHRTGPVLSEEQAEAADTLATLARSGKYNACLLEGVTGSGKTEVYFDTISQVLAQGQKQCLVLLPEIALTSQWLRRFEERFGVPPLVWHSDLPRGERRRVWRAIAEARGRVVVGARSALFLPFRKLGLIVVDEEHDPSFRQEDGVLYHARDMAVVRARFEEALIILSTATPSLETLFNVERKRYQHIRITSRYGGALLPDTKIIDMRQHPPPRGRWISPVLEDELAATLDAGEQALLFLNRRGYAPLTLCRHCGTRIDCPNCTAWLVEHRYLAELRCHHCDYRMRLPERCPDCGKEGTLVPCGPGVERIAEEVSHLFPEARQMTMASDTAFGPQRIAELVERIEQRSVDIIIGTQIITKGYHFPGLTLVGVVDADLGLRGADLRAGERTLQQLSQVAGRAGREASPGRVFLQTFDPSHPVLEAVRGGQMAAFYKREFEMRSIQKAPPFGRWAAIIVRARNSDEAIRAARLLAKCAPKGENIQVLGPAAAPLARLQGWHRMRLLVKTDRETRLQPLIRAWLGRAGSLTPARIKIDIDPYRFD